MPMHVTSTLFSSHFETKLFFLGVKNVGDPPHKISEGWLIFSSEQQKYVPCVLQAIVPNQKEEIDDEDDSNSFDETLLRPRQRSRTPEIEGEDYSYEEKPKRRRT